LEVEGGLLEDDTEPGQRRHRIARHVVAHDLDAAGIGREQAGEQLKQRGLARAVGAEQRDEFAGMGLEADAVDGADGAVGLDHVVEQQSGRGPVRSFAHELRPPAVALPGIFNRAYAAGSAMNGLRMPRPAFALVLLAWIVTPLASHGKDTGLIFVSNEKTNNLIVIDPRTYQVVKDIKVSRRPRDMHFNADHSKLYVACGDDDVIDIVDVGKLEVIGRLATGPSPETFALDEKRRRLYVANEEGSSLSI